MNNTPRRARCRNGGFTLVELMVSMTIGLIVVGAAYYITQMTGRVFAEQARRSETQLTLRGAVEIMRRDILRAGFAGVRSTNEMPGCNNSAAGGAGALGQGANFASPVALAAAWVDTVNGRQRLYLTGNFTTTDQYLVNGSPSTGNLLVLNTNAYAFIRSFRMPVVGVAAPDTFMENRFTDAFLATRAGVPGRMVNVLDLQKRKNFLRFVLAANTADPAAPSIQLADPLPTAGSGSAGCGWNPDATVIAPISAIRYEVVNTSANDAEVKAAVGASGGYMTGGDRWVLVRRELNMTTLSNVIPAPAGPIEVVPGTTRVVMDFLEDPGGFLIEGVYDASPPGSRTTPNLQRVPGPTAADFVNIAPEQLRSLIITLIARSAEQQAGNAAEVSRVQAGRRLARFETFMPNMSRNPGDRP